MKGFGRSDPRRTFAMATLLGAKSDMERDSGFSDASSEYLSAVELTDTEESGRRPDASAQRVALMGGSYAGVSPMIIMNNFLLKQPSVTTAEEQWGVSSSVEVMPQSQVVLLQPLLANVPKPSCDAGRHSRGYTPYKCYPRIAPHPGERPSSRGGSSRLRGSSQYEPRQRRHHHSHKAHGGVSPRRPPQAPPPRSSAFDPLGVQVKESDESLPLTEFDSAHEFQSDMGSDKDSSCHDGNKLKRFSNTYNILSKSGLLGITLRTKQLIKDNRHTQSQVQQLQQQTALLLEALSSGDAQLWTKLQLSLQDTEKEPRPPAMPATPTTPALLL